MFGLINKALIILYPQSKGAYGCWNLTFSLGVFSERAPMGYSSDFGGYGGAYGMPMSPPRYGSHALIRCAFLPECRFYLDSSAGPSSFS